MKTFLTPLLLLSILAFVTCSNEDELKTPTTPALTTADVANDSDSRVTFNWTPVKGAESYTFQLATDEKFTEIEHQVSELEAVSITVHNLSAETNYYWRVASPNSAGILAWSDARSFRTRNPRIPTLISPLNGSSVNSKNITFKWGSMPQARTYQLQVSTSSTFSGLVVNVEGLLSPTYQSSMLECNTVYYWRVRATWGANVSAWSTVFNFKKEVVIQTEGLVAYYPFNGNANDESGNGHHGVPIGAQLAEGRCGVASSSYYFDGVDDYIRVPHAEVLNLLGDFTISAWYRSDGCTSPCPAPAYHTIIMKRDVEIGPGDDWPWGIAISYITGTQNEFQKIIGSRRSNAVADYHWSSGLISVGVWQHVAVVVTGRTQTIYLDGQPSGTSTFATDQIPNVDDMIIGWDLRPDLEQFKGELDDIRVYNRLLSADEIEELYYE